MDHFLMCREVHDTLYFQDINKPNPGLGCLVERVLVLHSAGSAGPIGIVVILGCSARGLQEAFGAVTAALQTPSHGQSRTGVTSGEGREGGR